MAGGVTSRTTKQTELRDVGFGVDYSLYKIPVVDIAIGTGLDISVPTSKAARAAGLVMTIGPRVGLSWSWEGLSAGTGFGYTYIVNDNPTQQMDCSDPRFAQNCAVSGADLGNVNALHAIGWNASLGYKFFDTVKFGVRYSISNSYSAVEFPDDEFTAQVDGVQTGAQAGTGSHSFSYSLGYSTPWGQSIGLSMATGGPINTNDNKSVRNPLFDTESNLSHRTSYGISLTQAI